MRHYLYRHIRKDSGLPFYIGVGQKGNSFCAYETEYKRAYSSNDRNNHWRNIVKKCGYEIEIIYESDSYSEIVNKEVEFISLYKRKDRGGLLVNLTDGGEGKKNSVLSEETKRKLSILNTGRKTPQHVIDKISKSNTGKKRTPKQIERQRELSFRLFKIKHPSEKHSEGVIIDIIGMSNSGIQAKEINKKYPQISYNTISQILKGESWKRLSHLILRPPVRLNRKRFKDRDDIDVWLLISAYLSGKTMVDLGIEYDLNQKTVKKILLINNVHIR